MCETKTDFHCAVASGNEISDSERQRESAFPLPIKSNQILVRFPSSIERGHLARMRGLRRMDAFSRQEGNFISLQWINGTGRSLEGRREVTVSTVIKVF